MSTETPKKDEKLKKRMKVFGEQLKPIVRGLLKTGITYHNDLNKIAELTTSLMKGLEEYKDTDLESNELGAKTGTAVGLIAQAHSAIAYARRVQEAALLKLEEWAKGVQDIANPKVIFRHPNADQQSNIIQPDKKIITPGEAKRKGVTGKDIMKH